MIPFSFEYLVRGRFKRIAFLRHARVINELRTNAKELYGLTSYYIARIDAERPVSTKNRRVKAWMTIIIGFNLWMFGTFINLLLLFSDIYFKAMIIFKNLQLNLSFIDNIHQLIRDFFEAIYVPQLMVVIQPFLDLFTLLVNFKIDFGALNVTCVGAVLPYNLLINLLVVGVVIIIIDSKLQLFLSITQKALYKKLIEMFTREHYYLWSFRNRGTSLYWKISGVILHILNAALVISFSSFLEIDIFQNILLYSMSTVTLSTFFSHPTVNTPLNPCNNVPGLIDYDSYIYRFVSAVFMSLISSLFYESSKLLIPGKS